MKKKKTSWAGLLKGVLMPAVVVAVVVFFASALNSLDSGRESESMRQLEEALRRGCVACFAAEGVYPPTLDYLEDNYGIQIDGNKYAVFYDIYAENLMPDITVLERTP